LLESL